MTNKFNLLHLSHNLTSSSVCILHQVQQQLLKTLIWQKNKEKEVIQREDKVWVMIRDRHFYKNVSTLQT